MKKLLSVLLAVVLVLTLSTVAASAVDDDDIVLSVGSVSGKPGDVVEVPVSITSNAGFTTLMIELSYDANVLEIYCPNHVEGENCVDGKAPSITTTWDSALEDGAYGDDVVLYMPSQKHTVNPYVMSWAALFATEDITYTGVVATVKFKIKDTATAGDVNVSVAINSDNTVNNAGDELTATAASGKVTVSQAVDFVLGDVTGDGYVKMGDYAKILAHVKGTSLLTTPEQLLAADVTGDGYIKMGDYAKVLAHVKGTSLLS